MNTTTHDGWDSDTALDAEYMSKIFAAFYALCVVCGVIYEVMR